MRGKSETVRIYLSAGQDWGGSPLGYVLPSLGGLFIFVVIFSLLTLRMGAVAVVGHRIVRGQMILANLTTKQLAAVGDA